MPQLGLTPPARLEGRKSADQNEPNTAIDSADTESSRVLKSTALNMTIVTTAVPAIVASLHSESGYIWIGSAFILGFTAVTLVWGLVADLWGRKPIILTTLTIFLAGSLLCALVPDRDALIAGRAIQGIGASGMGVMINNIICDCGLYLAITVSESTPLLTPTCFVQQEMGFLDQPCGFYRASFLPEDTISEYFGPGWAQGHRLDWQRAVLGRNSDDPRPRFRRRDPPQPSATVLSLIVFGAVAVGIFIVNEWGFMANPVIPLRLLSSWPKAAIYGVFAFNAYVVIGITYYLPLYSQSMLGADALTSGLCLLPLIISCSLSAACASVFIQQTGKYRSLMHAAQVLLLLGVGFFIFEILTGVGVGPNIEAPIIFHAVSRIRGFGVLYEPVLSDNTISAVRGRRLF
ncbi:hypothetical protein HD806DRAFT_521451 [Xylariaceae sp. AK1471]|nr:hypothetical protein HD806DRAFT_521451 [Xylariaceae sp. AK1471]